MRHLAWCLGPCPERMTRKPQQCGGRPDDRFRLAAAARILASERRRAPAPDFGQFLRRLCAETRNLTFGGERSRTTHRRHSAQRLVAAAAAAVHGDGRHHCRRHRCARTHPASAGQPAGLVDDVLLVSDWHVLQAMRQAQRHTGLLQEPAGAAAGPPGPVGRRPRGHRAVWQQPHGRTSAGHPALHMTALTVQPPWHGTRPGSCLPQNRSSCPPITKADPPCACLPGS